MPHRSVIVIRQMIPAIAVAVVLGACSTQSSPTPSQRDQDYLAYAERIEMVVACVEEQGFEASSFEGFGVQVYFSGEDQEEVATRIEGGCWDEVEQRFPSPPSLSLEETYYYLLDVADCLRELGHDIPEAPSLDVYLDQAVAQTETWDPYGYLAQRGVDTYELQRDSCPPAPWYR